MFKRLLTACALGFLIYSGSSLLSQEGPSAQRPGSEGNGRFTFGLIGDVPYGPEGEAKFPNLQADINADETLSFIIHDGDIKNGSSLCTDAMFYNRVDLFNN